MKKTITLAIFCLSISLVTKAQNEPLHFTLNQFNSNLEINPAYAGTHENPSISLRGRKQWVGFDGSPTTFFFNGESRIKKEKLAAGLTIISDKIGITRSTSVDLSLASHIRVSEKGMTSFGIKLGVNSINSDFSKLSNVDLTDPLYANRNVVIPYVGVGGMYYTKKMHIGFAVPRVVSFENVSPPD